MTASRKGSWSDGGTDGELLAVTADRLRWRAPELTLVFARHAATRADEAQDRALALRANALVVAALVRLGKHAQAVEPAVSALREAESAGERELAGEVRVDLAASTRAVGLAGSAFVLVRPMLEGSDTRPALRAGALAEIVGGLAQAGRLDVIDEVLSEADRLYAADEMLSGDVRRILRALLCARIASFRRRWGNPTGAVAAATEGMTLLDGLSDPAADSGQARAELGLEMVSALLDAGEEAAALGQAEQTLNQPVRATSAAAVGRLMLILATRVHFPAGRAKEAHGLLAEIVRIARRHELDGLLADVLTSLAYAQEADGELTEALNSLRTARAAEQRRLRADTLARLIVLEELGAGTRLPDDTEALLRRVVRTPARSVADGHGRDADSREAASREMSGRELSGRGIGPGPRPRPNRGTGTYDSVGYERTGRGTESYDLAAVSQDYDTADPRRSSGAPSTDYGLTAGHDADEASAAYDAYGLGSAFGTGGGIAGLSAGSGYGSDIGGGGGGEGGGGGGPETSRLAASDAGGSTPDQDILGRELAGWEMVARERAAMDLAGQSRAGSDLVAADRAAPDWAGADPAAVDRVVGRAAVDSAAVDLSESEPDWSDKYESRARARRSAEADPKWPGQSESQGEHDEETGLLNRQGLRRRLAAARRQARPTALTLVRLEPSGESEPESEPHRTDPDSTDRFSAALIKAIDTAGRVPPEVDPDVLSSLAGHVRDMAPDDAELARPEERELAVLLPDTTRDEAEQFATTLREAVSSSDWDPQDPARGVNVSTGVAQYQEGTSEDALLIAAREALTSADHVDEGPDWQSVEPVYDLPPEDSGYTYIQEYAQLSNDGPEDDPEMAEYLAGFSLPEYGRQWAPVDDPAPPALKHDTTDPDEAGRSVLDRLDITRGSGGRRRAPDSFNADQSADYDQSAVNQPMPPYASTGDEILAAAEAGERASIPQVPEPEEIPVPPDSPEIPAPPGGPEVPVPPDPDIEPEPRRRRRSAEPAEPDEDPGFDPLPKPPPRYPAAPDIPEPADPDADPDPKRRRWTSELDPENPRARRRALPRDPARRAVEPDVDEATPTTPESTGRRRMPDSPAESEPSTHHEQPGRQTGRRRMPENFTDVSEAGPTAGPDPTPRTPAEPMSRWEESTESTGRRRMPESAADADALPPWKESTHLTGLGRTLEWPADLEAAPRQDDPVETTGRRRMPDAVGEDESAGRRRMPDALGESESAGRRRMPEPRPDAEARRGEEGFDRPTSLSSIIDALAESEAQALRERPRESTGARRKPDESGQPDPTRWPDEAPESAGRRRMPESPDDSDALARREEPGRTRGSSGDARPWREEPGQDTVRQRIPASSGEAGNEPGQSIGRRRMPDQLDEGVARNAIDSPGSGRRRAPEPPHANSFSAPSEDPDRRPPLPENELPPHQTPHRPTEALSVSELLAQHEETTQPRPSRLQPDLSDDNEPSAHQEPERPSAGRRSPDFPVVADASERRNPGQSTAPRRLPDFSGEDESSGYEESGRPSVGRRSPDFPVVAGVSERRDPGQSTAPRRLPDLSDDSEPARPQESRRPGSFDANDVLAQQEFGRYSSTRRSPGPLGGSDAAGREVAGSGRAVERPDHGEALGAREESARAGGRRRAPEAVEAPELPARAPVENRQGLPPEQSGPVDPPVDLDDFPSGRRRVPQAGGEDLGVPPEQSDSAENFSLGQRRGAAGTQPAASERRPGVAERLERPPASAQPEPKEPTGSEQAPQPSADRPVDELSARRLADERAERRRRRTERAPDQGGDDRPSRLRRRERTDVKLADLLAEALVAYQSSTADTPGEDVLSAYEDLGATPDDDTGRHRFPPPGETGY